MVDQKSVNILQKHRGLQLRTGLYRAGVLKGEGYKRSRPATETSFVVSWEWGVSWDERSKQGGEIEFNSFVATETDDTSSPYRRIQRPDRGTNPAKGRSQNIAGRSRAERPSNLN